MESSIENLLYGSANANKSWLAHEGKKYNRWNQKPENHLLNDYEQLMVFLMTANYQKSIDYREKHKNGDTAFNNETRLEKLSISGKILFPTGG